MRSSVSDLIPLLPWHVRQTITLPADASRRTFHRLMTDRGPLMLMDAPPPEEDVHPYIHVAQVLRDCGLSAPEILFRDEKQGYVVMEDLGHDTFTQMLHHDESLEPTLYHHALLVLAHLWDQPLPTDLPPYDLDLYQRELSLYPDWAVSFPPEARALWDDVWADVLKQTVLSWPRPVLVLRDYHVDNMIWLPDREGAARCGLLDFQDAVVGHPAYDVVSLLWDARRDVAEEQRGLDTYLALTQINAADFMPAYHVLGLQRTLKIIGIFHRLNRRDGKPRYLAHLPRLYRYVRAFLDTPACAPVAKLFDHYPALWGEEK